MTSPKPPASPDDRALPPNEETAAIAEDFLDVMAGAAPSPRQDPAPGPTLDEIAAKADAYADNMNDPGALRSVLHIIAQNVRDAASRRPSLPSREEVERDAKALVSCARAVGIAIGSGTHADVDERREAAALASLLSLIPYRSDR